MFTRRHPFLFFLLVLSAIFTLAGIILSLILTAPMRQDPLTPLGSKGGEKVGVVEIKGAIFDPETIMTQLKRFRKDNSIKAIVLRIESPGGAVGPSQEIFREVRKTSLNKTVIASMGGVAASGGYYIASGANGIVANPGTITGSIGVILGYTNFQDLLQKIGLAPVIVKSGPYKDIGSSTRKMTENEQQLLQNLVDKIHKQFISDIAESRDMDLSKVLSMADGRILLGQEAKELGLVDRLGNFEDALEWAGRKGGIKGEIVAVYAKENKFSLVRYIVDTSVNALTQHILNLNLFQAYF